MRQFNFVNLLVDFASLKNTIPNSPLLSLSSLLLSSEPFPPYVTSNLAYSSHKSYVLTLHDLFALLLFNYAGNTRNGHAGSGAMPSYPLPNDAKGSIHPYEQVGER